MRKFLIAAALTIPTACTPVQANTQQIAELAVKALSCAEITPHATRALRYVMEGQPYELYYATTLAQPGINAYQRWVLKGLYEGLEQVDITLGGLVEFAHVWTSYCIRSIGAGKIERFEQRQYRGE